MRDVTAAAGLSSAPDPSQARPGKPIPQNIANFLVIVRILLGYGRHLTETLERRAAARGFSVIAQFFGTARLPVIRARLARGLLRAMALERVLLARAARGRDLVFFRPRDRAARGQTAASVAACVPSRSRPVRRRDAEVCPESAGLPSMEELEAEIRRRPVGRALADICSDLGISPSLCEGNFWFDITCGIMWNRGNLPKLMKEFRRREVHFCDTEADRNPALGWPEPTRDGIRRVVGFFVGETPVLPDPLPAPPLVWATGIGPP